MIPKPKLILLLYHKYNNNDESEIKINNGVTTGIGLESAYTDSLSISKTCPVTNGESFPSPRKPLKGSGNKLPLSRTEPRLTEERKLVNQFSNLYLQNHRRFIGLHN